MLDYFGLVRDIYEQGKVVDSRLGPTREVIGGHVMLNPDELVWRPKFNKALGWMELLQLIGGVYEPRQLMRVAPMAREEYFGVTSAYGPRIYNALPSVHYPLMVEPNFERLVIEPSEYDVDYIQRILREVRDVPNTRRAVLFIGKSWDTPDELACTLTYQFLSREGKLNAVVNMRSWDVIRGLPYDIVMFGGLLQAAAHILNLELGRIHVVAGSIHLYESDLELMPTKRQLAKYRLKLNDETTWNGIRMMCKNQVYQSWNSSPNKVPHFIEVDEWKEV